MRSHPILQRVTQGQIGALENSRARSAPGPWAEVGSGLNLRAGILRAGLGSAGSVPWGGVGSLR